MIINFQIQNTNQYNAFLNQFNLVCDDASYVNQLLSLGPIGMVIVTPFMSAITDWYLIAIISLILIDF